MAFVFFSVPYQIEASALSALINMWYNQLVLMSGYLLPLLAIANASQPSPSCKASPGSTSWPSLSKWNALNASISGQLIKPAPPGAVCHPDQPTYDAAMCPTVAAEWFTVDFYSQDPSASAWPFWNNDSCLPWLPSPCSSEGYPVYAVNATCKEDVKKGVDFARENNVRLVVKSTGHDYLGRCTAPNALTIWAHSMKGLTIQDVFKPQGCRYSINSPAVTFAAGTEMSELNLAASLRNLTILSGGQVSVGYGGFATGGGHSALSATYGMAADQVLEMEIVSPGGEILTVNECQNQDLFWALRGGGGSTFGVITSTTIKAFPTVPFIVYSVIFGTAPETEPFWDSMTYWLSQYPALAQQGLAGYGNIAPNISVNGSYFGGFQGIFVIPALSPSNTSDSVAAVISPITSQIMSTWPNQFIVETGSATYPSFYDWWFANNGPDWAGVELMVGSRLLDAEALTANLTALKFALKGFIPPGAGQSGSVNFVSGKGVWNAVPRGGSNAVNPAWRKAVVHMTNGVTWNYLDPVGKAEQENLLTNTYVEALRVLTPNSGAYVNEADSNEPNFQQTFWGSNYQRLLDIKRKVDPGDVFWCKPCVGNERWKEAGNLLCRVKEV